MEMKTLDPKKIYEQEKRTQEATVERIPQFEEKLKRILEICAEIGILFLEIRQKAELTNEITPGVLAGVSKDVIESVRERMDEDFLPFLVDQLAIKLKEKEKEKEVKKEE